ncbi:MAG: preprotein translocase subunit SecA [Holosporales bacterium]|jgi:preprotein translocase subunit SecA|nr:preprotein translocase subunit SecA [Holosporales bacterium]
MLLTIKKLLFGRQNTKDMAEYREKVTLISTEGEAIEKLTDEELTAKTASFKERLAAGSSLDDILPEAFAVVREAASRRLGMRHFDVQLIGGMVLHEGKIAEMKTGEGKTLVATLAVYLNALAGKGVHVVTVNDYLASRDAGWMGQIYKFLGLSVGVIIGGMTDYQKRAAYAADITYGTNHEFGFDYLRDNLKFNESDMVMRDFNFAVIDEVDSILIDEARTPLIISGANDNASRMYVAVDQIVKSIADDDFEIDEKNRIVTLTDAGVEKIEKGLVSAGLLEVPALYDTSNITMVYHVNCALKAHKLFARDVDYIVKDDQVLIIDEFTGRIMDGRRYSEGLHQALEAKEGVEIQTESQTIATISYQNLFRLYPKLAGMTGTAMTEEEEFEEIYKLRVVSIPPHKPVIRKDHEDSMFIMLDNKDKAVLGLIKECHTMRQPVLVGTTSLERSEYFSKLLTKERIKHNVLNAKQHEREAHIIAEAGTPGAVTIATNMAGRGTDIKLGGSFEMRFEQECEGITDSEERGRIAEKIRQEIEVAHDEVVKMGGLFVIGTERNDSRRIDNQLRGRSGRQGDPGASKYFISLEDDLMRKFGSPNLINRLKKLCKDDEELSFRWISKAIEKAQQRMEAYNFDIRKQLLRYDDVMNDQRRIIYEQRRILMQAKDVTPQIQDMIDDVLDSVVEMSIPNGTVSAEWNVAELCAMIKEIFTLQLDSEEIKNDTTITAETLRQKLGDQVASTLSSKIELYGEDTIHYIEKDAALKMLDTAWRDHLIVLEHLRRGINLRAYAQKNPLNEYKFEAFSIFSEMLYRVKKDVLTIVFGFESPAHRVAQLQERLEIEMPPLEELLTDNDNEPAPVEHANAEPPAAHLENLSKEDHVDWQQQESKQAESESSSVRWGAEAAESEAGPVETKQDPRNVSTQSTGGDAEEATPETNEDSSTGAEVSRNAPCPCGSGRRYKNCHGQIAQIEVSFGTTGDSNDAEDRSEQQQAEEETNN